VELPSEARIVYDVLYGSHQLKVGRAEQRWRLAAGRYELRTELLPVLGPKVQYLSRGRVGAAGLVPESFAEYRGKDRQPRTHADFDWQARVLSYGRAHEDQRAPLEPGTQDVNALAYQLAWMGDAAAAHWQVATGKKVAPYRFTRAQPTRVTVGGKEVVAWLWRSTDEGDRTEVWVAPQLGHLPVRVHRSDDDKQLQFVAREVEYKR